jgi:polysaccharide pyruvyl transferase WcaK-like protein
MTVAAGRRRGGTGGIFIYGYHGFHNVGADCRLLAIADQLRRRLPDVPITVSSFHQGHLEDVPSAKVVSFHPAKYRWAARRHIAAADVLILSEGNMLTDEFSPHLVLAFITAIEQAAELGTPSVGLALDAGRLSAGRIPRVVEALDTTSVLTVRAPQARDALASMGVRRPIEVTADCAVSMPVSDNRQLVAAKLGFSGAPVFGIAPVDFYMWPARVNPLGRSGDFVRWPFKATWPDGGRARSEVLTSAWAKYGGWLLDRDASARLAVIVMDPADRHLAQAIASRLSSPRVSLLSGASLDCRSISTAIGCMSSIATSRYHALVLALAWGVPFLALGHDTRMQFIADDMGLEGAYIPHDTTQLADTLIGHHLRLEDRRDEISRWLIAQHTRMCEADSRNYDLVAGLCTRSAR